VTPHYGIGSCGPVIQFCPEKIFRMKRLNLLFTAIFFFCASFYSLAQPAIGIGTNTPHTSALLDAQSNTKGVLIPRMNQAEINAIASPAQGLMVFNTNSNSFQFFNGVQWNNIGHSGIITGLNNKIPRFVGLWGLGNSLMTDNNAGVSLNTTNAVADPSAILDVASTSKGVLVPRMSSVDRVAIISPAEGLLVYDNTTQSFWYNSNAGWMQLNGGGGGGGSWNVLGNDIYNNNTGNVGIGASTPSHKLTVNGNALISDGLGLGAGIPDLFSYKLDIIGNARTRIDQYINRDLWVDRNFDVDGTSNLMGSVLMGNNLTIGGSITSVDAVAVTGDVTVDGGKGIVRGTNSNQRVVTFPAGSVSFGNAPANYSVDVTFALSNVFAATPIVSLGQITNGSGPFERWSYTIHSVDIAAHTFLVRFYTANGTGASTAMTLNFIAIGTAL
jgi:hypothetical protein